MGVRYGSAPERIIGKIRETEIHLSAGSTVAEVCTLTFVASAWVPHHKRLIP
jgi:hypothetical protein